MTGRRPRLLVATTVPETAWTIMRGQLAYLRERGFEVILASSPGPALERTAVREGVRVRPVGMARDMSPRADARALFLLVRLLRRERPDITLAGTPKAGLLVTVAAFLCRVELRVYLMRGLRLETERGARRAILWALEWVTIRCAHTVIVVSPSLLDRAVHLRLLGREKGVVLGKGASNGVDLDHFRPSESRRRQGVDLRRSLGIPESAFVFGFVGRMNLDKGIGELIDAFAEVARSEASVWLLVIGAEEQFGLPAPIRARLHSLTRAAYTGWLDDTAVAHHAMDCLVLPTHREGFPNVALEAAAAATPVITTRATGAIDSIEDGKTGLLVDAQSTDQLAAAMRRLATDRASAVRMGAAGREFVTRYFGNQTVWANLGDRLISRGS